MSAPPTTRVIDVDFHAPPPSARDLRPYLSTHYNEYISTSGMAFGLQSRRWYPPFLEADRAEGSDGLTGDARSVRIVTCMTGFEFQHDPYVGEALTKATNDWLQAEVLPAIPDARATISVCLTDPTTAVREIERLAAKGAVAVLLPIRSDAPYGNRRYRPVFEACERTGLVAALHAWGSGPNPATPSGPAELYVEDYFANVQIAQAQIASLIAEGVFVDHPQLRVSLLECGFAWIRPFLWRLDKDWKGLWREIPWAKEPPSTYFERHFRVSTAPAHLPPDPALARETLELADAVNLLMHAAPHGQRHGLDTELPADLLDPAEREAIWHGNAVDHYRLSL